MNPLKKTSSIIHVNNKLFNANNHHQLGGGGSYLINNNKIARLNISIKINTTKALNCELLSALKRVNGFLFIKSAGYSIKSRNIVIGLSKFKYSIKGIPLG
tara:strand:+ start:270 stop:572 length:303 start_codon:yes stop_codon:yes gene_type:complete